MPDNSKITAQYVLNCLAAGNIVTLKFATMEKAKAAYKLIATRRSREKSKEISMGLELDQHEQKLCATYAQLEGYATLALHLAEKVEPTLFELVTLSEG